MLAYHSDPKKKIDILKQLAAHRERDEIVKGMYWQEGKGCAVGCTIHSGEHMEYETRFGIPMMLARLEDSIFEGLPNEVAKEWPLEFMGSIKVGADLSRVGWQFLHWLLTDKEVNPGIDHPSVQDAVKRCADVLVPLTKGGPVDHLAAYSAARSARLAAYSAYSAARSAAYSADSACSAARSARSAAYSASHSADSASYSAYSAAHSADWAAHSAVWRRMADKLLELLRTAGNESKERR
jgi:hypothetical protein